MNSSITQIQGMPFALAQQDDLADIVSIYNQAIETKIATAELTATSVTEKKSWFSEHLNDANRPIYTLKDNTLEDGEKVIAWASYSDLFKRRAYRISSELSIYIHNDYQGRGLGKEMVEKMLTKAAELSINNVLVKVFSHNPASLAIFAKFGFEQWGYLPAVCDMDGFIADVVIMGKKMND